MRNFVNFQWNPSFFSLIQIITNFPIFFVVKIAVCFVVCLDSKTAEYREGTMCNIVFRETYRLERRLTLTRFCGGKYTVHYNVFGLKRIYLNSKARSKP